MSAETNKWRQLTARRFSTAHPDAGSRQRGTGRFYFEAFQNASQAYRDEQFDIYFGKTFHYQDMRWGNVMGVEASDEAVDWLFRIQSDFGIPISLTMNQMDIPDRLLAGGREVRDALVEWLAGFYRRGLRSCTICSPHMMRWGLLQRHFPDMTWKNTVNQIVDSAQKVADFVALGYTFIQLDRSLNRDVSELRRVRQFVDRHNAQTGKKVVVCLLVVEECLPFCPFKREHDDFQARHERTSYWECPSMGGVTCNAFWRAHPQYGSLPRTGTNCCWNRRETFETYAGLVDVFKYSGRLIEEYPDDSLLNHITPKNCYCVLAESVRDGRSTVQERHRLERRRGRWIITRDCFADVLEENLTPLMAWHASFRDLRCAERELSARDQLDAFRQFTKDHFWTTPEYHDLEETLMNCRNQCWRCHKCEDVYGVPHVDSLLSVAPISPPAATGAITGPITWSSVRKLTGET